jgi:hypothetical protein
MAAQPCWTVQAYAGGAGLHLTLRWVVVVGVNKLHLTFFLVSTELRHDIPAAEGEALCGRVCEGHWRRDG